MRVDFNVQDGDLKNSLRIKSVLPTIKYLLNNKCRVVILSHKGRPNGNQKDFSLKSIAGFLSKVINRKIIFVNNFNFAAIRKRVNNSPAASVFLLENLRFLAGEEKNSKALAKKLASLGDFYVNDAFSVSHRANASVAAITKFIPAYAGFLMEKEIKNLSKAMKKPKRPLVIILGGAKISDKIGLIKSFLKRADYFLIGGGMANTFIASWGIPVGDSLYEKSMVSMARDLIKQAGKKFFLPSDVVIENRKILDIGPETAKKYAGIIKKAKTIIWNGPVGYCEDKCFLYGSLSITKAIAKSRAFSVVGGGETTALIANCKLQIANSRIFVSTGGGAMLEYLAGKKLPGIESLK